MTDCIFCKIVSKELSSDIIYEDNEVLSFMNIKPVSKGHILVVPKHHSENLIEADDSDLAPMILAVKKLGKAVMKATGAAGFNIGVNTGPAAGQEIFHTHFHIIPRYANDGLKMWPHSETEPKNRTEMAAEIKKHI